jgi:prepilin-type N-terminal cleavage/methylation domain-containing protein/prepilin-type processing-associated H-X9-DG protein
MKLLQKKGFTLIELLVVIAIIAILASILFPVFGRARENARRSSCQSNLKQIGLGIMQYSQDFDELMPNSRTSTGSAQTQWVPWQINIQPYVKSTQVFKCPSNPSTAFLSNTNNSIPVSYMCVGGAATAPPAPWGGRVAMPDGRYMFPFFYTTNLASLETPSTTLLVGEHISRIDPDFYATDTSNSFLFTNHLGTSCFLFADGHVKSLKPTSTMNPNMWTVEDDGDTLPTNVKNQIIARQAAMN